MSDSKLYFFADAMSLTTVQYQDKDMKGDEATRARLARAQRMERDALCSIVV